jgi:inner membrane protein
MATLYTHPVVGLTLARLYAKRPMPWAYWGLAAVLPMVPDLDAFSTAVYGGPLGHRGITHSLVFALGLSVITASLTFRYFRTSWWGLTGLFFLMIASHGLLDAMTWGGAEIPFFWPLPGRYGNWGPLPVSNIGLDWPNRRFLEIFSRELLWIWLPCGLVVGAVTIWRHLKKAQSSKNPVEDG